MGEFQGSMITRLDEPVKFTTGHFETHEGNIAAIQKGMLAQRIQISAQGALIKEETEQTEGILSGSRGGSVYGDGGCVVPSRCGGPGPRHQQPVKTSVRPTVS